MIPDQTTRLSFRYFGPGDFELLKNLHTNPEVMRFVGGVKNATELQQRFDKFLNYHQQHPGYGYWCAMRIPDKKFVGVFLVKKMQETEEPEIGYLLMPEFWGLGLATEGAKGLVRYARERLGVELVVGVADPANQASRNVLEKAGLKFVKIFRTYETDCAYYKLNFDATGG